MSQRNSEYARVPGDLYETPEWVTQAVVPYLPPGVPVWEPACGSGKMVRALEALGIDVVGSDISSGSDFLEATNSILTYPRLTIVTNPPYSLATEFIKQALELTHDDGFVAMLLRTDFDHAKSRRVLFADCPMFATKVVLTKRIVWFDRPGAAPSFNHAWYIWDWTHSGAPTLEYAP